MIEVKLVYLEFTYYHDGHIVRNFYYGGFAVVNWQLRELIQEDLPQAKFMFTSQPFDSTVKAIKLFA
jgi:hypothetical protein